MYVKVKKRKTLFGLWIALALLAIIVTPVAVIVGVLYNNHVNEVTKEEPRKAEELFNDIFNDTLHNIKDTGKLSFEITEQDINAMLASVVEDVTHKIQIDQIEKYIHNFYFIDNEDSYQIGLEVNIEGLYKTRVDIYFDFDWINTTHNALEGKFTFTIIDLVVGNLSLVETGALGYIPESLISQETLEGYLEDVNLSIKLDYKNLTMTYCVKDMLNDLISMINSESSETEMLTTLIQEFARYDAINFSFNHDGKICGEIDLTSFHDNTKLATHDKDNDLVELAIPSYVEKVEQLRNDVSDPLPAEYSSLVLRFLIRGYVGCGEEDKPTIESLAPYLNRIGISDPVTYVPATYPPLKFSDDLMGPIFDNINEENLLNGQIAKVDEDSINEIIQASYIYGYNFLLETTTTDGHIVVNYFIIDNFYCNIVEGHLYFSMGLNFNGYELTVSLLLHVDEVNAPEFGLALFLESIYLGEHKTGNEINNILYPLLENAFADSGFATFDETNGYLIIDFEPYLDSAFQDLTNLGIEGSFSDFAAISIVLRGTLEDIGYIDVTWYLKQ